jgi:hypothetical protein
MTWRAISDRPYHPGLHHHGARRGVNLHDGIHPLQAEYHLVECWDAAAREQGI